MSTASQPNKIGGLSLRVKSKRKIFYRKTRNLPNLETVLALRIVKVKKSKVRLKM